MSGAFVLTRRCGGSTVGIKQNCSCGKDKFEGYKLKSGRSLKGLLQ